MLEETSGEIGSSQLPELAARTYRARSPWVADKAQEPIELWAGKAHRFVLKPFEVLTLQGTPGR